ncbi:MAG: HD domain-containing protein [Candidatus Nealsonbacteria bacterium]|nr:HD domain-containing protein [Candidatus Nealsonbacteria bacterium]
MTKEFDVNDLKSLWEGKEFDLASFFPYFQWIAQSLQDIIRYKRREDIAGQSVRENDLQHCYKIGLITLLFAIKENESRSQKDKLDIGLLVIMGITHDISEIIKGDIAWFEKNASFKDGEYEAFIKIIEPLPNSVREYLTLAFRRVVPDSKYYLDDKEARFFKGVEQAEHLSRALHECRQGNLHFAPGFIRGQLTILVDVSKEFPSLIEYVKGFMVELENYEREFEKRRGYYLREYIKRGGKVETFPF